MAIVDQFIGLIICLLTGNKMSCFIRKMKGLAIGEFSFGLSHASKLFVQQIHGLEHLNFIDKIGIYKGINPTTSKQQQQQQNVKKIRDFFTSSAFVV